MELQPHTDPAKTRTHTLMTLENQVEFAAMEFNAGLAYHGLLRTVGIYIGLVDEKMPDQFPCTVSLPNRSLDKWAARSYRDAMSQYQEPFSLGLGDQIRIYRAEQSRINS
ncbi:MAG: hypothetical protein QFB87_02315 [Patescibacteria group bacterium]|nr:hypothetical protein [Patescibacteria group bacterium]